MSPSTTGILLAILLLAIFTAACLGLLWAVLRVGPGRGSWNQPAAMLRRPSRPMFMAMYAFAALHVALGIALAIALPGGGGFAIVIVMAASASFYVLCAHSWALAHRVAARTKRA